MLVLQTEGAPPPPRRKRRKPTRAELDAAPLSVPYTTVTVVRAHDPLGSERDAADWLSEVAGSEELAERLMDEAAAVLERALAADAAASGRPFAAGPRLERAVGLRIGFGSGEMVAESRFADALEIDVRGGAGSRRRQRAEAVRPLERIASVLRERERLDACEVLVPRVRADLDGGRTLAAALGIEAAVAAVLAELEGALDDPDHERDMDELAAMRGDLAQLTEAALADLEPWAGLERDLEQPLRLAERILRRRRVLRP